MSKKLISITKDEGGNKEESVTFQFDDNTTLTCDICGPKDSSFLHNGYGNNSQVFYELGIRNPHKLYKDLGIYVNGGECPQCRREDLDKVFDYLLENYLVKPKKKEPKQPSEWDWLLD